MTQRQDISATDLALWRAAAAGEAGARQQLIDQAVHAVAPRLSRFVAGDREELEQRIATAVLGALAQGIEPRSSLIGFLHWRARGEITSFLQERARAGRLTATDVAEHVVGPESPLRDVQFDELLAAVRACIAAVPNGDHREALQQRLLEGTQPSEIASQRGIEPRRVRVWIARALAQVRSCLIQRLGDWEAP